MLMPRRALLLNLVGPAPITGTWDPAKKSANITLTSGNLLATKTGGLPSVYSSVLGTVGQSSGVWTFSVTITLLVGGDGACVGVGDSSTNLSNYIGGDTHSIGYFDDGNVYLNASVVGSLSTWAQGDIIGVKADASNKLVYFSKNSGGYSSGFSYSVPSTVYAGMTVQASDAMTGTFT